MTSIYHTRNQNSDSEGCSRRVVWRSLRWTSHALRSDDVVLREVLTFVPEGGARGRGRPRRRFYDTLELDLAAINIIVDARKQDDFWRALTIMAANRKDWRTITLK